MKLTIGQKVAALAGAWSSREDIKRLLIRRYWAKRAHFDLRFAGIEVRFSTEDFYSNFWFYGPQTVDAVYEPAVTALLIDRIRSARSFADVGANLGYFSMVAGVARPGIPIFAFEMDETLRPIIERNLKLNGIDSATIVSSAISSISGQRVNYVPHPFSFLGKVANESIEPYPLQLSTTTLCLDDFFGRQDVLPNLVKMDIDGCEMAALRGMELILDQEDLVMLLEVHARLLPHFGSSLKEVEQFLAERGFKFAQIGDFRRNKEVSLHEIATFDHLKSKSGDMRLVSRELG